MPDTQTSGQRKTDLTAANAVRMRRRQDRLAADLQSHGWLPIPPELADAYNQAYAEWQRRQRP